MTCKSFFLNFKFDFMELLTRNQNASFLRMHVSLIGKVYCKRQNTSPKSYRNPPCDNKGAEKVWNLIMFYHAKSRDFFLKGDSQITSSATCQAVSKIKLILHIELHKIKIL